MNIKKDLYYTKEHEWVRVEGETATVGITDFAQGELGDVVFVEFPETGSEAAQFAPFGTIEAVKTVADLFSPVSGKVLEINEDLEDHPEKVNADPYGDGWMVKIKLSQPDELKSLMSADDYEAFVEE